VPGQKRKRPERGTREGQRRASQAARGRWYHLTSLVTRNPRAEGRKLKLSQGLVTANASDDDIMRGVFRTRRSRDHDVVVVMRTINLGYGNLEWGGNGEGLRKGRSIYE
jgi:hypothetical protein